MNTLLLIFILLGIINSSFADNSLERTAGKFLKKNWDIVKLKSFAGNSENHNFLRISPNHRNLKYTEREKASFVITVEDKISHPLYKIIPVGFFLNKNNRVEIEKIGKTYYYRTPKLSVGDNNVFTCEAWLVYREQYEKFVSHLKRLNPKRKGHKNQIKKLTENLERSHIVLDKMEFALKVNGYPVVGEDQIVDTPEDHVVQFQINTATDANGDSITYHLVNPPSEGTLVNCLNGTNNLNCEYIPKANYFGKVSFTYKANDGQLDSEETATVTINVKSVNDAPVMIGNQNVETNEDIALPIVLSGATDIENDNLTYKIVTPPTRGIIENCLGSTGDLECDYIPNENYSGEDSFTYIANDGVGNKVDAATFAKVTINVVAVNDAPVMIGNQNVETNEDIALPILLSGATDVENDTLTYKIVTPPTRGIIENCLGLTGDLECDYIPNENYSGSDSFTYIANDGVAKVDAATPATVTINVNPVNDAPVMVGDQSVETDEDMDVVITLRGAIDVDSDTLTYRIVNDPQNGELKDCLKNTSDLVCTYSPGLNFSGNDSFTYIANDGVGNKVDAATFATVTISVKSVNDAPVARVLIFGQNLYAPTNLKFTGATSSDPDGHIIDYRWVLNDGRTYFGKEVDIQFLDVGTYMLTLVVTDDIGEEGRIDYLIEIKENHIPIADFTVSSTEVEEFEIITLDASNSSDPDENQNIGYTWTFDDGTIKTGKIAYHFFEDIGIQNISLTVTDESGLSSTKNISVNVTGNTGTGAIPEAVISIAGGTDADGNFRGQLTLDSYMSSVEDGYISDVYWDMGDGTTYYESRVSHQYQETGIYEIRLMVHSDSNLVGTATRSVTISSLNDPLKIPSEFDVNIEGVNPKIFNPQNLNLSFEVLGGGYLDDHDFSIFINGEVEITDKFQKTSNNKIEGTFEALDGENNVTFLAYDQNENYIYRTIRFFAGAKTLDLQIIDESQRVVPNKEYEVFLTKFDEIKFKVFSDAVGKISINNAPTLDLYVWGIDGDSIVHDRIHKNESSKTLVLNNIGQPSSVDNNDLSLGLQGWDYTENHVYVDDSDGQRKLAVNVPVGQDVFYSRIFVHQGDKKFLSHEITFSSANMENYGEIILLNKTSGEMEFYTASSEDLDYVESYEIKKEVSVLADDGDVIYLFVRYKSFMETKTTWVDSLFYESEPLKTLLPTYVETTFPISGFDQRIRVKLREIDSTSMDNNSATSFYPLDFLSVGDFNKYSLNLKNTIYGEIDFQELDDDIASIEIDNFILRQGSTTCTIFPGDSIAGVHDLAGIQARPFYYRYQSSIDDLDSYLFDFRCTGINFTQDIGISIEMNYTTYSKSTPEKLFPHSKVIQIFKPVNILRSHNLDKSSHYGEYNHGYPDFGDFWSQKKTIEILDVLKDISGLNLRVGDVSNINGSYKGSSPEGFFKPHGFHQDGYRFDLMTTNFNLDKRKNTIDFKAMEDLWEMMEESDAADWISKVFATQSDGYHKNLAKFTCLLNLSGEKVIAYDNIHKNHWHIKVARFDGEKIYPKNLEDPNLDSIVSKRGFENGKFYNEFEMDSKAKEHSFIVIDEDKEDVVWESYKTSNNNLSDLVVTKPESNSKKIRIEFDGDLDIDKYMVRSVGINSSLHCSERQHRLVHIIDDCNKDGNTGDYAVKTDPAGGFISFEILLDLYCDSSSCDMNDSDVIYSLLDSLRQGDINIINNARLCGDGPINGRNIFLDGESVMLENVAIGDYCDSVNIQGNVNISSSSICTSAKSDHVDSLESTAKVIIFNSSPTPLTINNSSIVGNVAIDGSSIITGTEIHGDKISIGNSTISNTKLFQNLIISDATISDSEIISYVPSLSNNFAHLFINGNVRNNSDVSGQGIVEGIIDNSIFDGDKGFWKGGVYHTLHLFKGGKIINGGKAMSQGWVAGTINGGVGDLYSTSYHHSGVNFNASIGPSGHARCYNYVQAGTLNKEICHLVYDGTLTPNTMNIGDWINGEPWPEPEPDELTNVSYAKTMEYVRDVTRKSMKEINRRILLVKKRTIELERKRKMISKNNNKKNKKK